MVSSLKWEAERILSTYMLIPRSVERLVAAYTESWRTYHNDKHILKMLELARTVTPEYTREVLELLILYHDVWYKVGQPFGTNEQNSASWAIADFGHDDRPHTAYLRMMLRQGIEATATHTLGGVDTRFREEVSLLLDLDLWGLGQSPERFKEDTEAIWLEYQPVVTRQRYDVGRSEWATSFLARKRIYHTDLYKGLEEQARENLRALIV